VTPEGPGLGSSQLYAYGIDGCSLLRISRNPESALDDFLVCLFSPVKEAHQSSTELLSNGDLAHGVNEFEKFFLETTAHRGALVTRVRPGGLLLVFFLAHRFAIA
jgi:hypothetical protein